MIITVNGDDRVVPPEATISDLVEAMSVPSRGIAVALDQVVVPRSAWPHTVLVGGARVDVVTAMQGG